MEYKFFYLCFHFPALYDPTSNTRRSLSQPKPCRQSVLHRPKTERLLGAIPIPRSLARFPSNNRLDCVSFFFSLSRARAPRLSLATLPISPVLVLSLPPFSFPRETPLPGRFPFPLVRSETTSGGRRPWPCATALGGGQRDGAAGIAPQRHPPARDDAGWGGPCCWARDARR